MALENYIINASNTGAAGYHNAMAGMDQRKREAEVDRHNAFNRMNVDRQYKDTKMREAFEMAALMDVDETNNGPALDYLDRVSDELGVQRPERSQIGPALRTYRTQIGGGDAYGSIVYGEDENGNPVVMQPTKSGTLVRPQLPQGVSSITLPTRTVDAGNQILQVPTRGTGGPVNVYDKGVAPDKAPEFRADVVAAEEEARGNTPQAQADLEAKRRANEKAAREQAEAELAKQQQSVDRLDIITAAQELYEDPALPQVYGTVQGATPSVRQDTVDTEGRITRVIDLLTMANLGKMKGVLSDTDIKILANAGSILKNRRISPTLAKQELKRVEKVMKKYEALMSPGGAEGVPEGVDPELWNVMTPEERAAWE